MFFFKGSNAIHPPADTGGLLTLVRWKLTFFVSQEEHAPIFSDAVFPDWTFYNPLFLLFFLAEIVFSGYKKTALRLFLGARYWIRTSDPRRVKAMLYH